MKKYIKANKYPDFEQMIEARRFLNSVEPEKIDLVKECRDALLAVYSEPMGDEDYALAPSAKEYEILRDYKSIAAEDWTDCDIEEADQLFDDILAALDDIHADDAAAWI